MVIIKRYIEEQVKRDLDEKMVFIAGPRQVGKTTFVKEFLKSIGSENGYLSWDIPEDREIILRGRIPNERIVVFDEIHKYRQYRNFLKGVYDLNKGPNSGGQKIIVTGSGMLDTFRYGGDSLQGRYHLLRMLPLSVSELNIEKTEDMEKLFKLGGFPEPFFSSSEDFSRRWSREYRTRLLYNEIRDIEKINEISKLELLSLRLPELVGSPLSINSLREDIDAAHKSLSQWLNLFERLYYIIRIPPFGPPRIKAIKKQNKHYHIDWTLIEDDGSRFENFIAIHLYKWVSFMQDAKGYDYELRFYRDKEGREIDFVILNKREPMMFIEAKLQDREVSKSLKYMQKIYKSAKFYQVCLKSESEYIEDGILLTPALKFLKKLV